MNPKADPPTVSPATGRCNLPKPSAGWNTEPEQFPQIHEDVFAWVSVSPGSSEPRIVEIVFKSPANGDGQVLVLPTTAKSESLASRRRTGS